MHALVTLRVNNEPEMSSSIKCYCKSCSQLAIVILAANLQIQSSVSYFELATPKSGMLDLKLHLVIDESAELPVHLIKMWLWIRGPNDGGLSPTNLLSQLLVDRFEATSSRH